jgi:hypothetical protein
LGLTRYETAFQMLHKLRAGLVRPERDPIGAEGRSKSTKPFHHDPVLSPVKVFLETQAGFGFNLDAFDLETTALINAVVPPPGAVNFPVECVLFTLGLLELSDDVLDVLTAGFVGHQNSVRRFNHDQVFYTYQANEPTRHAH